MALLRKLPNSLVEIKVVVREPTSQHGGKTESFIGLFERAKPDEVDDILEEVQKDDDDHLDEDSDAKKERRKGSYTAIAKRFMKGAKDVLDYAEYDHNGNPIPDEKGDFPTVKATPERGREIVFELHESMSAAGEAYVTEYLFPASKRQDKAPRKRG